MIVRAMACGLIILFFFIYSELSFHSFQNGVPLFNSPDETANYFFSKEFARNGELSYSEPLSLKSVGYIHPRSMTAVGESIVPVGFLGMPVIYGALARVFGVGAIPFFTPFFAAITPLFFYILVRNVFSKRIAIVSSILLLIHPAYVYNANRAMLPNIFFIDMLIIGAALVSCAVHAQKKIPMFMFGLAGGGAIGVSLWTRFSESIWVCAILFFLWVLYMRRASLYTVAAICCGMIIPLGLMTYFNTASYGNPLLFGYQNAILPQAAFQIEQSGTLVQLIFRGDISGAVSQAIHIVTAIKHAVLPFGMQPRLFQKIFFEYEVFLFLPFTILALFGFFTAARNALMQLVWRRQLSQCAWIASVFALSAWLIVFYGSWVFYDNLNHEISIGTSYVRYWLPIYIFTLPFGASVIVFAFERVRGIVTKTLITSIVVSLALFSFYHVFAGSSESIDAIKKEIASYHVKRQFIIASTPDDAVIVSARSDKIFFPVRRVAEQMEDFREIKLMKKIIDATPVYYYGLWGRQDAATVSKKFFEPHDMRLEFVADADEREHLYRVVVIK